MANFLFPWEIEPEKPEKAKVTPLTFTDPTPEEYEQAMNEFYNEILQKQWRCNK